LDDAVTSGMTPSWMVAETGALCVASDLWAEAVAVLRVCFETRTNVRQFRQGNSGARFLRGGETVRGFVLST
jgi:hypothetical protein